MKIVREKYEQNVHTGHMNEADFWRTFFQSHYFTMDRMQPSNSRDLFADCVKRDDESKKKDFRFYKILILYFVFSNRHA
jgi:hypothetical protein